MYWATNNVISIVQTTVLKNETVRAYFEIPKPPVNAPAMKLVNPFAKVTEVSFNCQISS